MEGSEKDTAQDPGLSEAPTGAPAPTEDEATDVNESHPNQGELEEAVKETGLDESREDATDGEG